MAWLSIGITDPGTLLAHLNRLRAQLGLTGTAVVAVYEPDSRVLTWARAGHLPPMLARSGRAAALDPPAGMLLGADPDAGYPATATGLRAGDLVLFYTDGLVERRTASAGRRLAEVTQNVSDFLCDPW